MKSKWKIGIVIAAEFFAIAVILVLVFFAGKRSYDVTFDLNGGTLISGDLEQRVTQGKNATPPTVAKDGCYLYGWSGSYTRVTNDITIKAIWEWNTSEGFDYSSGTDSNYCEIIGCYKYLSGDVYVGAYHDEKKVLGIADEVFKGCDSITNIYMLDGILSVGDSAFEDCSSVVSIELPSTLYRLGVNTMRGCESLESIVIPEGITVLPAGTFYGCTSLTEVVLPSTLTTIEAGAFIGCDSLTEIYLPESVTYIASGAFSGTDLLIKTSLSESEAPSGWQDGWHGEAAIEWEAVIPELIIPDQEKKK